MFAEIYSESIFTLSKQQFMSTIYKRSNGLGIFALSKAGFQSYDKPVQLQITTVAANEVNQFMMSKEET